MRDFILAILAGVVATAVYKTYTQPAVTMQTAKQAGQQGPVIGATMLTSLPTFAGQAAEAGHGDAVLNANPAIKYTPAFGSNTNVAAVGQEWVGPYDGYQASPRVLQIA